MFEEQQISAIYIELNEKNAKVDNDQDAWLEGFANSFKLMDYIAYYSPMWMTTKSNLRRRPFSINLIGLVLVIAGISFYYAMAVKRELRVWSDYSTIDNINI